MYKLCLNSINENQFKDIIKNQTILILSNKSEEYLRYSLDINIYEYIGETLSNHLELFNINLPLIGYSCSDNIDDFDIEITNMLKNKIYIAIDKSFANGALKIIDNSINNIIESNYMDLCEFKHFKCLLNPKLLLTIK